MDLNIYLNLIKEGKFNEALKFKNNSIPNNLFKYYSLDENKNKNDSKLKYLENQKIKDL